MLSCNIHKCLKRRVVRLLGVIFFYVSFENKIQTEVLSHFENLSYVLLFKVRFKEYEMRISFVISMNKENHERKVLEFTETSKSTTILQIILQKCIFLVLHRFL